MRKVFAAASFFTKALDEQRSKTPHSKFPPQKIPGSPPMFMLNLQKEKRKREKKEGRGGGEIRFDFFITLSVRK
jgi:hypothetical protein